VSLLKIIAEVPFYFSFLFFFPGIVPLYCDMLFKDIAKKKEEGAKEQFEVRK
jgi:hypothetical protein